MLNWKHLQLLRLKNQYLKLLISPKRIVNFRDMMTLKVLTMPKWQTITKYILPVMLIQNWNRELIWS